MSTLFDSESTKNLQLHVDTNLSYSIICDSLPDPENTVFMRDIGDGPVVVDRVATNSVSKMIVPAPLRLHTLRG